ncbi:MAG TPA: M56 family metallopeptidase [Erythrobacter sp.]|nr:M56 family metallopeptidase [Erythrobacter sp.]
MNDVLAHTLVWTGVLIAAVLLLRRPVARHFGPQVAYALWALPLARLLLPPITLPAWMKPAAPLPEKVADAQLVDATAMVWDGAGALPPTPAELPSSPPAGFDLMALLADLPLIEALLLLWLGGAAVFLCRRFAAYFDLRDELLAEGREMGRVRTRLRTVRLIETPATTAPLAMGVLDPVIALPPGFMALYDRQARDLALAHELAHHHGGDLLVNVLVQPLFALHWWNPLASYGWLALRRDQEAACDARVMARRDAAERAAYASLIARYAAAPGIGSNAALTAPMACPVLGEKSIIHRLRSLSMSELSPRRRMAGRALLGAGLLILPLTASISYAASEAARTVQEAPEPPAPPSPPAPPEAPDAPLPPEAPEAPEAPDAPMSFVFVTTDDEGAEGEDGTRKVIIRQHSAKEGEGEGEKRMVRRFDWDGKTIHLDTRRLEGMTKEEHEEMRAAIRKGLAEAERAGAESQRALAIAMAEAEKARGTAPRIMMLNTCDGDGSEPTETRTDKDGQQTVVICKSRVFAQARSGLEEARAEIARDKDIPEETRKQVLETLDRQIARWKEKEG